jgi:hypothetical protein
MSNETPSTERAVPAAVWKYVRRSRMDSSGCCGLVLVATGRGLRFSLALAKYAPDQPSALGPRPAPGPPRIVPVVQGRHATYSVWRPRAEGRRPRA